jgi:hypothetical protein
VNALILVASLALSQTAPQRNGLVESLGVAIQTIRDGATPTITNNTRASFGGNLAAGAICIRGTLRLDPSDVEFLKLPAAGFTKPADYYVATQICAPGTSATPREVPAWLRDMAETWGAVFTSTQVYPRVVLATRKDPLAVAALTGFACACSSGVNCTWQPPKNQDGTTPAPTACPLGVTLSPGTWSGTGAVPKTCLEMFGHSSWDEADCPLR